MCPDDLRSDWMVEKEIDDDDDDDANDNNRYDDDNDDDDIIIIIINGCFVSSATETECNGGGHRL